MIKCGIRRGLLTGFEISVLNDGISLAFQIRIWDFLIFVDYFYNVARNRSTRKSVQCTKITVKRSL
ncbi:hypothetical protein MNV_510012 [Candidatus Methanoperedens nitroreducens]|uniref:Uncharacterized protein n=1 Tax=Candidatus Methanoperedens nitratireducens TaxID=1392998 RepID=A0A284VRJ3_9EURY|nr:hypothetical protein MNV_510012 [Candidatus Methanoperedens nitroreducens]